MRLSPASVSRKADVILSTLLHSYQQQWSVATIPCQQALFIPILRLFVGSQHSVVYLPVLQCPRLASHSHRSRVAHFLVLFSLDGKSACMCFAWEAFKSNTAHSTECGELPVHLRGTAKVPFNYVTKSCMFLSFFL